MMEFEILSRFFCLISHTRTAEHLKGIPIGNVDRNRPYSELFFFSSKGNNSISDGSNDNLEKQQQQTLWCWAESVAFPFYDVLKFIYTTQGETLSSSSSSTAADMWIHHLNLWCCATQPSFVINESRRWDQSIAKTLLLLLFISSSSSSSCGNVVVVFWAVKLNICRGNGI